jgi:hypothetical protein
MNEDLQYLEDLSELNRKISSLVSHRDSLAGSTDRATDMALERNVELIQKLYRERKWKELASVCGTVNNICLKNLRPQKPYDIALNDHASMPPGIEMPMHWNSLKKDGKKSYFRFGVPIVVSAKSGVGKSTLARCIALNNWFQKIHTVYATNEDSMAEAIIGMFTAFMRLQNGASYEFEQVEDWMHSAKQGGTKYKDQAKMVYVFAESLKKYVRIVEIEDYSMSSTLLEIERTENVFGVPVKCAIIDYIQQMDPEHVSRAHEIRLQNIEKSRMWKNYLRGKSLAGIAVSQLNDDGRTAESTQFEKDAGQWLIIERERDKDTDELSSDALIRVVKGRRTGTGRMACHFDGAAGVFLPSGSWQPIRKNLYDNN